MSVNWAAVDASLLPRALWARRPELRAELPEELADRALVFHRGVDAAHLRGTFLTQKVRARGRACACNPATRF